MKAERHSKIIEIVKKYDIETQDELADRLKKSGFEVTQATISRDIRELKLTKISGNNGKQKYVVLAPTENIKVSERLNRSFKDGVVSIDYVQNIIVIKTLNGMAMAVAAAIDSMRNTSEIMGSIAGDDTVFCVVREEQNAVKLVEKLKSIAKKGDRKGGK